MLICGIDPMDQGALAFLDGTETEVIDMPTVKITKSRHELDVVTLLSVLQERAPARVYVEKMQPMPVGSLANFKRGGYLYGIRTACAALKISLMEVQSKQWQKTFGIGSRKDGQSTKDQSYLIASRIFPSIALKSKRNVILDGRCDALLIAEYGRRIQHQQ